MLVMVFNQTGRRILDKYFTRPLNLAEFTTTISPPGPGASVVEFIFGWFGVGKPGAR